MRDTEHSTTSGSNEEEVYSVRKRTFKYGRTYPFSETSGSRDEIDTSNFQNRDFEK